MVWRRRALPARLPRRRRPVRRAVLHVLRGHRPGLARPGAGLALPLRARRRAAPRPCRDERRGFADVPPLRRAEPTRDARQERPVAARGSAVGRFVLSTASYARRDVLRPVTPWASTVTRGWSGPAARRSPRYLRMLPAVLVDACAGCAGARWSTTRRSRVGRSGGEGRRLQPVLVDRRRRREVRRRHRRSALAADGPLDLLAHDPVDVDWLADRLQHRPVGACRCGSSTTTVTRSRGPAPITTCS